MIREFRVIFLFFMMITSRRARARSASARRVHGVLRWFFDGRVTRRTAATEGPGGALGGALIEQPAGRRKSSAARGFAVFGLSRLAQHWSYLSGESGHGEPASCACIPVARKILVTPAARPPGPEYTRNSPVRRVARV